MKFTYWNVMIDIGFWSRLAKKKIQQYKLDASAKQLIVKYRLSNQPNQLSILNIDAYSYGDVMDEAKQGPVQIKITGQFINTNTLQQFKAIDMGKQQIILLQKQKEKFAKMLEGEQILNFTEIKLIIFGQFKRHEFQYQFLSPSFVVEKFKTLTHSKVTENQQYNTHIEDFNAYVHHFIDNGKQVPQLVILKDYKISTLKQFFAAPNEGNYIFCISDTTNFGKCTGYHTNSVLALLTWLKDEKGLDAKSLQKVNILLMKQYLIYSNANNYNFKNSEIWTVDLSESEIVKTEEKRLSHPKKILSLDLKSFMDDRALAKQAVDLNIKLMKWRLLPSLDIPKIQSRKCLLFGAGTLGCQLARNLIGWGVKHITFIDYSKVSYSNPVRQSLYEFQDTIKGGKPKAETAAQKLIKIYPQIQAKGYHLQIPMPGHYVTKQEHIKETFQNLDLLQKLVSEHDVLFLLLDSRQARWLPTVLANKYNKACITVGLGFDSFVIVRHGVPPQLFNPQKHKQRLCCYFCNDIVTPQNTMKDRTLDQMCTVTRPGLSFLSAAYASQLYISLIHHPLEHHACGSEYPQKLQTTDLGRLPHHIRGNMSDFETNIFYGRAFQQCVACSKFILDEFTNNREEFMLRVLNDPSFIHQVVNLKQQLERMGDLSGEIIQIYEDEEEMIERKAAEEGQSTTNAQSKEQSKKQ